jgi:hypothetical protein
MISSSITNARGSLASDISAQREENAQLIRELAAGFQNLARLEAMAAIVNVIAVGTAPVPLIVDAAVQPQPTGQSA